MTRKRGMLLGTILLEDGGVREGSLVARITAHTDGQPVPSTGAAHPAVESITVMRETAAVR